MPKYIPRQIEGKDVADNAVDHTAVAESFIHLATAAPDGDDDEGTGFAAGCLWIDYSNGETYVCTASSDENAVWHAQDGSDDVNVAPAWQGLNHGYETGGGNPAHVDEMSRWSVNSPYAASDIGTLPDAMYTLGPAVEKSGSTCFIASGRITPVTLRDEVASFPAASSVSITDIGNVNNSTAYAGYGWSATKGYLFSGNDGPGAGETVQDYALVSPFSSSDVAEHIETDREYPTSHDDDTHSYIVGGAPPGSGTDKGMRYQKGTSNDSSDVGELGRNTYAACGNTDNSNSYAFVSGGGTTPAEVNEITRFAFASPFTGADVGEHASPFVAYGATRGVSTPTHGFTVSRTSPGNVKERFAFGSPASGADIGEVAHGASDDICCHGV